MEKDIRKSNLENELRNWKIHLGAPVASDFPILKIPMEPHVFNVKKLRLLEGTKETTELEDVLVMLGHGIVTGQYLENWKFLGTNQPVEHTVKAYEEKAKQLMEPPLDCILVCRKDQYFKNNKVNIIFSHREYPYIVPMGGSVHIVSPRPGEPRELWGEGMGIKQIVASCYRWGNVKEWTGYWYKHYDQRQTAPWALRKAQ